MSSPDLEEPFLLTTVENGSSNCVEGEAFDLGIAMITSEWTAPRILFLVLKKFLLQL